MNSAARFGEEGHPPEGAGRGQREGRPPRVAVTWGRWTTVGAGDHGARSSAATSPAAKGHAGAGSGHERKFRIPLKVCFTLIGQARPGARDGRGCRHGPGSTIARDQDGPRARVDLTPASAVLARPLLAIVPKNNGPLRWRRGQVVPPDPLAASPPDHFASVLQCAVEVEQALGCPPRGLAPFCGGESPGGDRMGGGEAAYLPAPLASSSKVDQSLPTDPSET